MKLMPTRIFAVYSIFYVLLIMSSCGDGDCAETELYRSSINSINLTNIDNSDGLPVMGPILTVPAEAYAIQLDVDLTVEPFTDENTVETTARVLSRWLPSIQKAMAIDPFCEGGPYTEAEDLIVSVRLITINDFNADFPAGSNMSSQFRSPDPNSERRFMRLSEIASLLSFSEGIRESTVSFELLNFAEPDASDTHQFRVVLEMESGAEFSMITAPVILLPKP